MSLMTSENEELSLDHYRNRIQLAESMGLYDYAKDMAALMFRLEVAEKWSAVQAASREASRMAWNHLRMGSAVTTNDDHTQHDAVMMEAGARMLIIAGNEAAEAAARA